MTENSHAVSISPADAAETEDMAKYGISRVPVDYFHYGNFRYTSLAEAVAEAKRQIADGRSKPARPSQPR